MNYSGLKPLNQGREEMKRFNLIVLAGLVTVFFIAGTAFAQWQGGQGAPRLSCQERFDALDTNHDGKLTLYYFACKLILTIQGNPVMLATDVGSLSRASRDSIN